MERKNNEIETLKDEIKGVEKKSRDLKIKMEEQAKELTDKELQWNEKFKTEERKSEIQNAKLKELELQHKTMVLNEKRALDRIIQDKSNELIELQKSLDN